MTFQEIKTAIERGTKLRWNDPDEIEGNDYRIQHIFHLTEEMATIHYGTPNQPPYSEAEVPLSEIVIDDVVDQEIHVRLSIGLLISLRRNEVASKIVTEFLKDKFSAVVVHEEDNKRMICTIITSAKTNLSAEFNQQNVKSQIEHTIIDGVEIIGYKEEAEIYGNV